MKKFLKLFAILFIIICMLTGCSTSDNTPTLEEKSLSELEYLEDNIVLIMNKFIKDEYLDGETNSLKWEDILKDARKIEESLATILIDLTSLNIGSEEIAKLSQGTNRLIIAIENEDELNLITELSNIYALIPNYLSKYLNNEELIFKKQLKMAGISSFVAFKAGNIELAKSQMAEVEGQYSEKMKDVNYVQNNEYNVNKIFILLQEFKNAIETGSEELVKTKYLLFTENIF